MLWLMFTLGLLGWLVMAPETIPSIPLLGGMDTRLTIMILCVIGVYFSVMAFLRLGMRLLMLVSALCLVYFVWFATQHGAVEWTTELLRLSKDFNDRAMERVKK